MGLLKDATVEQAAAKVGLFGGQGSGKTTTSALIALGLSKTFHDGAPVAFMDTENGSDYLVPIFKTENVRLVVVKSRAFRDMKAMLPEAEELGCCAVLVDSYTHPWQELNATLKTQLRVDRLEFRHMDQLKTMWRSWTDLMLNSPLHVIVSGRLGYVWDREEDENGKKGDLIKLGTKMKSESEAGYEPSLLIEMEAIQAEAARTRRTRAKKGSITHYAYVLKDRWRTLNGLTFNWRDLNEYKAGDYQRFFDPFRPHFDKLAIGTAQRAVDPSRSSSALFDSTGQSAYEQRKRRVQIVIEEFDGTIVKLWPEQTAKAKALKQLAIETLFQTRSQTQVESLPLERLDAGLDALKLFEEKVEDGRSEAISDPKALVALLVDCMGKVDQQVKVETPAPANA